MMPDKGKQDTIEQDRIEQDTIEQDTIEQDTIEQDRIEQDTIDLIRDVLDNQLVGKDGEDLGRVDGLIVELDGDGPPRLVAIETGWATLARRLSARRGRKGGFRIPWSRVKGVGIDVNVDLTAGELPALRLERWLRDQVIRRIPGGG